MTKRSKVIWGILIIVILIAAAGGCFYFWRAWWPMKQAQISLGLASPKFPWRSYTQEELNKMYPQIRNADVPTRITPEETYAKFREALRTNDLELVLEQIAEGTKRAKQTNDQLKQFYQENKFKELYDYYPEKINRESMHEAIASFYYIETKNGRNLRQSISFSKNSDGDWKMETL